jgi:RNA polymerase sigma factor (sigma-70 family)
VTTIVRPGGDRDDRLVAAVRCGDDRAFEALYERYHERIAAYVLKRVKDHGRAEDITQEVFVSALRGMRGNHHPIAFEPWLYRIARNACIDQHRSQRPEEVVFDVDSGAVGSAPTPDSALIAKQDLNHLWGAFRGLSDTCHEVLVLRELEGLSYAQIGERLGMSRGAVETSLLRARRRLAEEYDELATGEACRRTQKLIGNAADRLGRRELHRLARHVSHCQPCRREALAAGMDASVLAPVPLRRRVAQKIALLVPFPLRERGRADEVVSTLTGSPGMAHAPLMSEQLHAGWAKAAAAVAVLVAGAGAGGVGTRIVADGGGGSEATRSAPERTQAAAGPVRAAARPEASTDAAGPVRVREQRGSEPARRVDRARGEAGRDGGRAEMGGASEGAERVSAGGGDAPAGGDRANPSDGGGDGGSTAGADTPGRADGPARGDGPPAGGGGGGSGGGQDEAPAAEAPAPSGGAQPVVDGVTETLTNTVGGVGQTVNGAADGLGQTLEGVDSTLQGDPDGLNDTLEGVNQTVQQVAGGLGQTVQGATQGLEKTLGGLLKPRQP